MDGNIYADRTRNSTVAGQKACAMHRIASFIIILPVDRVKTDIFKIKKHYWVNNRMCTNSESVWPPFEIAISPFLSNVILALTDQTISGDICI